MCTRDECPDCGATALEACHKDTETEDCARQVLECPTCGAETTQACLEEA
jgi:ribosomal protein S27AE